MSSVTVNNKPARREVRDVSGADFLMAFTKAGWAAEDVQAVGRAFHVAHEEIEAWAAKLKKGNASESEAGFWIAVIAAGAEVALLNRGRVTTQSILAATNAELHEFIDYYEAELADLWVKLEDREGQVDVPGNDHEWLLLRDRFDRLAGYLWECNQKSGVWNIAFPEATA